MARGRIPCSDMKNSTQQQINDLISYYKNSAYAHSNDIAELAEELMEEGDEIEEVEKQILTEITVTTLVDYEYIECENQGSFMRHIWHKEDE